MPKRTGTNLIASDVHQRLRRKILTLGYKPGTRLDEGEVCALFGADPRGFRMVLASRMAIEGYATRMAAVRASRADIDPVARIVDEMGPERRAAARRGRSPEPRPSPARRGPVREPVLRRDALANPASDDGLRVVARVTERA
jgi:DNA-binding GntR family transcriptional regulator